MKKHSLLKVLLSVLLIVVVATWFLPVSVVEGTEFTTSESIKIGLFNLASYIGVVLQVFGPVIMYILAVGGLYGVLHRIPQYRLLLDKIVDGFKGREWLFMVVVGVLLSVLSSMAGLSLVVMLLFPFIFAVVLLMGYDKITAAMLTVGSVIAGLIGTVFSKNDIYGVSAVFSQFDLAKTDVLWKIVLLVVSLALVLVNTITYAKKHRKTNANLEDSYLVPKKMKTDNKKIYPLVIVLDLMLVVLTLAFISWDLLGVSLFTDITNAFTNPTGSSFIKGLYGGLNTILGIPSDGSMTGVFGYWTLADATLVVLLASVLLAFIYRKSFNSYISSFSIGAKKAIRPAFLVGIAYMILVCIVTVPFEFSLLKYIIDLNSGFNLIVMCVVAIVFSLFTVESYYGVVTAASYLSVSTVYEGNIGIIALVWQTMYGLVMLVTPTSVVLIATLSCLDISYKEWLKAIWKLFLELLVAILLILFMFSL